MKFRASRAELALLAIILLQLSIHLAIGEKWFFQDEHGYLTMSWLVSKGYVPDKDFMLGRPQFFFYPMAAVLQLTNNSFLAARLSLLPFSLATTVLIYLIAVRFFDKKIALLSSLIFALSEPSKAGFMVLQDSTIAFFLTLAFLFLAYNDKDELRKTFLAGLALGFQFTIRQSASLAMAVVAVFLSYVYLKNRLKVAKHLLALSAGITIPLGLVIIAHLLTGSLNYFIFNLFNFSRGVFSIEIANSIEVSFPLRVLTLTPILPAFVVLKHSFGEASRIKRNGLFFVSIMAIAGATNMIPLTINHHALPYLPGLAIVSAWILLEYSRARASLSSMLVIGFVLWITLYSAALSLHAVFLGSPQEGFYPATPPHFFEIAEYVESITTPEDKIAAYSHLPMYYLIKREPASYHLSIGLEMHDGTMEERVIDDLSREKPRYVIITEPEYGKSTYVKMLYEYLGESYEPDKVFSGENERKTFVLRRNG